MPLVVTPFLMRADTAVHALPEIAVRAQHLVSIGESILRKPLVRVYASAAGLSSPEHLPELAAVIVDVIDCQKERLCLATARANVSAVMLEDDPLHAGGLTSPVFVAGSLYFFVLRAMIPG